MNVAELKEALEHFAEEDLIWVESIHGGGLATTVDREVTQIRTVMVIITDYPQW